MSKAFEISFLKTMYHEGRGLSNHKDDAGGETYSGIARNRHPTWAGWQWIDQAKESGTKADADALSQSTKAFYWREFWEPIHGDALPQAVAEEMFDTAVNTGVGRAVKFLQSALNLLNRNGTLYMDLTVDGGVGPATLAAVEALPEKDVPVLVKILNIFQANHYIDIIRRKPTQSVFARGWLARVTL